MATDDTEFSESTDIKHLEKIIDKLMTRENNLFAIAQKKLLVGDSQEREFACVILQALRK